MLSNHQIFSLLSIALSLLGFVPYAYGICKGVVKPHLFSWLIWTLVTGMISVAQLHEGGGAGGWATVMISLLCGVIVIASLFYGEISRTKLDWFCLCVALTAIPLWFFSPTSTLSVILLTLIELLAFGPTLRKTYLRPHSESLIYFTICLFKYLFATLALDNWTFDNALYPVATGGMAVVFIVFTLACRMRVKQATVAI
jgi:hypothetical protein